MRETLRAVEQGPQRRVHDPIGRTGVAYTGAMVRQRVLIDVERLRRPNTGLGQAALHLGNEFLAHPSDKWRPVFLIPPDQRGIYGQPIDCEIPGWKRRYLRDLAPSYDLWHVLHQDASYLPNRFTPYILTIHDLNFLEEKSPRKARRRLRKVQTLVDGASAITVISKFTEGVVREHLELGETPVWVVHNGLCSSTDEAGARPDFLPVGPFLFTLGVVRRKKNFSVLIDFLSRLPELNLVIAGNTDDPYAQEIRGQARALGVTERLVIPGEIDDHHKTWLFRNCEAFVFPSLYEGFGLPLIEAMSFGKPTFCSTTSSLPEIGGPDVFYWQSFDADHMLGVFRRGMEAMKEDPARSGRLKARARGFSWCEAARRYAELYERHLPPA